ncbi:hypothetical protein Lser_V15G44464 [Lactuca serriola]
MLKIWACTHILNDASSQRNGICKQINVNVWYANNRISNHHNFKNPSPKTCTYFSIFVIYKNTPLCSFKDCWGIGNG